MHFQKSGGGAAAARSESTDINDAESLVWRKWKLRMYFKDVGIWFNHNRQRILYEWVLVILLGLFVGIIGFVINIATNNLFALKFNILNDTLNKLSIGANYITFVLLALSYAFVAGCLCWIVPEAAGSGIPEIKTYLNGLNLRGWVRFKVLIAKTIGVCFSVASGLPIGKEGPLIHIGAIAGAAFSQGTSSINGVVLKQGFLKSQDLRNDYGKRNYVTYGAAAGVAAAFNAPIGGILFTLEEGSTFWSQKITIRSFVTALMTQLIFALLSNISGSTLQPKLGLPDGVGGAFEFGNFDNEGFFAYELPLFALIGIGGGILGALFNKINKIATEFRIANINFSSKRRMCDLLVLTFLFISITFLFPLWFGRCYDMPTQTNGWTVQQLNVLNNLVQYNCGAGEYNPLASLFLTPSNTGIQNLFHFLEVNGASYPTFPSGSLLAFFIPFYLFSALVSGTFAPAGLFVPTLFAGAAYGRLIGHIMNSITPGLVSSSGTYALIGACALLGGVTRMMIAGTVIVAEAAGTLNLILPFMITFVAARYTGNYFNKGMYDMQIEIKKFPFVEPSLTNFGLLNYQSVYAIMSAPVVCFNEINRVGTVFHILKTTTHNGFPIVSEDGHLLGFILRKHILVLLQSKSFISTETPVNDQSKNENENANTNDSVNLVDYDQLEKHYPKYPKLDTINLTGNDMTRDVDFSSYMDTSIISINAITSIQTVNKIFITLSLRHMVVCDNFHHVIGIITRHNLNSKFIEDTWNDESDGIDKFVFADEMEVAKRDVQQRVQEQQEVDQFKEIMVHKYVTQASKITTGTTSFYGSQMGNSFAYSQGIHNSTIGGLNTLLNPSFMGGGSNKSFYNQSIMGGGSSKSIYNQSIMGGGSNKSIYNQSILSRPSSAGLSRYSSISCLTQNQANQSVFVPNKSFVSGAYDHGGGIRKSNVRVSNVSALNIGTGFLSYFGEDDDDDDDDGIDNHSVNYGNGEENKYNNFNDGAADKGNIKRSKSGKGSNTKDAPFSDM